MAATAEDQKLSRTSRTILEALKKHTSLAWPIFKAQCSMAGCDPTQLMPNDVEAVVPKIASALSKFTTPTKAEAFRTELIPSVSSVPPARVSTLMGLRPPEHLSDCASRVCRLLLAQTPLGWQVL